MAEVTINYRAWTERAALKVEIATEFEGAAIGEKLGAAVRVAFASGANLIGADLRGANLIGADLIGADLTGAALSNVYLRGADLTSANLIGADLRGADLTSADLIGADLRGAKLRDANLIDANLIGAKLIGADLTGAKLIGAKLRDADLTGAKLIGVPVIEKIDAAILAAIEAGGQLKMDVWHTCGSTHCRYGWAIHLAGDAGYSLERKVGSAAAGALIYATSRPEKPIPAFTGDDDAVLADIRACAAEQSAA